MDRCSKTDRRIYNRDPGIDPPGFRSCFKYIYVFRFRGGVSRRKWDFFFLFFFSFFFSAYIPRRLIALVIALENYWIATALMLHPSGKWGSLWSSCTDIIIENFKSSWLRRFGSQSCNENSLSLFSNRVVISILILIPLSREIENFYSSKRVYIIHSRDWSFILHPPFFDETNSTYELQIHLNMKQRAVEIIERKYALPCDLLYLSFKFPVTN